MEFARMTQNRTSQKTERSVPAELEQLDRITRFLDTAIRIPGTNIRLGADAVLGLIPGLGDWISAALSGSVLLAMVRHGVQPAVFMQMIGNLLLDAVVGAIPLLGDVFDIGFRANRRNFELYLKHYQRGTERKPLRYSIGVLLLLLGAALVSLLLLAIYFTVALTRWLTN